MDTGDVIALGSAVVAVVSAAVAIKQASNANTSARASADAAARGAAADERAAAAAERALELQTRYSPPWKLEHRRGDTYALMNLAATDEHDVEITTNASPGLSRINPPETINARSETTFMVARSLADGPLVVTVTWVPPDQTAPMTWTHPLPPKPRPAR